MKNCKNIDKIYSRGLIMHTCFAVTTKDTPLSLLDQKIFSRQLRPEYERRTARGRNIQDLLPVKEKESHRWIKPQEVTIRTSTTAQIITVCDRECDLYDFFKIADKNGSAVVVRASQNRNVNRSSRYAEKDVVKLWNYIKSQPSAGSYVIDITSRQKTRHCKSRKSRVAQMEVKFCKFRMNPPRNNPKHKKEVLPDIKMYAIHALEKNPPEGEDAVEWMLLTNQPITTLAEACQRVRWYSLRWRIEMYFKVLQSGFRVEMCRLDTADRLKCYLTIMSIVAWRLFMIALISRTNPSLPCSHVLSELEWTALVVRSSGKGNLSATPPSIADAVIKIAKPGDYLAKKRMTHQVPSYCGVDGND
jgi:hypothetical protein